MCICVICGFSYITFLLSIHEKSTANDVLIAGHEFQKVFSYPHSVLKVPKCVHALFVGFVYQVLCYLFMIQEQIKLQRFTG